MLVARLMPILLAMLVVCTCLFMINWLKPMGPQWEGVVNVSLLVVSGMCALLAMAMLAN